MSFPAKLLTKYFILSCPPRNLTSLLNTACVHSRIFCYQHLHRNTYSSQRNTVVPDESDFNLTGSASQIHFRLDRDANAAQFTNWEMFAHCWH